jgi:acetolactate synthase-1/2/3 large subunit
MSEVNGGYLIMKTLRDSGVTHLFTIVGGHNFEIVDACQDLGIQVTDVRHEQQAAHMADAMTRFTRQPAVVAIDGAPGLVNAFPGIQVAFESQVPIIVLTGQGSLVGRDIGVMQAIDQLELVRPITKWRRTCFDIKRLPEYASMAVREATTGRPGPVFLDAPLEIVRGKVDETLVNYPKNYRTGARAFGDPALVKEAMQLLASAQRPLIVAGSGVWWSHAENELREFARKMQIPVVCRNMARGIIAEDDPLGAGFLPTSAAGADVYLIIGTRLDWTIGFGRPPLFDPASKAIQVDILAEKIGKNRPVDVGIHGDAKAVLGQMIELANDFTPKSVPDAWRAQPKATTAHMRAGMVEQYGLSQRPAEQPMHSIQLVQALAQSLPREARLIVDGGYIAAFGLQYTDALSQGGIVWVGSTGHLGVGVSFAAASKLAEPGRPVVALMGDGSFGLSGIEFDTAVRHGLPIVVVIANDAGWGEVRDGQRRRYGSERVVGTNLAATRYDDLARALGGHGELVQRVDEIGPAVQRSLASGKPSIVNVLTDRDQRSLLVTGMPWPIE